MSIYYIRDGENIYELDATSEISYEETGKITNNVIESGESVSDHYINDPVVFTIEGVISDIKSPSTISRNSRSTLGFIEGLKDLKTSKRRFTFHFGEKVGSYDNCLFQDLMFTQNVTNGNSGETDSFSVRATIKQIRIASRAAIVPFRDGSVLNDYQSLTQGAGSTEEATTQEVDNFTEGLSRLLGSPVPGQEG